MQAWSDLGHGQVCSLDDGRLVVLGSRFSRKGISGKMGLCADTLGVIAPFHNRLVSFEVNAYARCSQLYMANMILGCQRNPIGVSAGLETSMVTKATRHKMHPALKLLYRLLPLWSHSNVLNRNLEEILDELDVGSAVFW
jgi:hypothetical protein